jgi:hypothetical protein
MKQSPSQKTNKMKYNPPLEVAPGLFLMGVEHKREGWLTYRLRMRRFKKAWRKAQHGDCSELLRLTRSNDSGGNNVP